MRDVCNKLPKTASGQPAFDIREQCVKWQFYKATLFMKDQFIGRDMNSSFQQPASQASPIHDLRRVKNPYIVMSLKNTVGRAVGDAVMQQLQLDENQQEHERATFQLQQQQQQQHEDHQNLLPFLQQ
ncbi:hypothetical protein PoB_006779100 [Plakobranchus ocellatus]|uniref:Uncharacterized protein n=1 Tax=Plakobranchus ocellatus TaxID=259542 RepID=A0AAV4DB40_9GAST|nr:hypothetical protein PoB_006779100 [Plakobranchus ocellatus]